MEGHVYGDWKKKKNDTVGEEDLVFIMFLQRTLQAYFLFQWWMTGRFLDLIQKWCGVASSFRTDGMSAIVREGNPEVLKLNGRGNRGCVLDLELVTPPPHTTPHGATRFYMHTFLLPVRSAASLSEDYGWEVYWVIWKSWLYRNQITFTVKKKKKSRKLKFPNKGSF